MRYHEIALKGRNRSWFINTLVQNIRRNLSGLKVQVSRVDSGIEVKYPNSVTDSEIIDRLSIIFGIAIFKLVETSATDIPSLMQTVKKVVLESSNSFNTFILKRDDLSIDVLPK